MRGLSSCQDPHIHPLSVPGGQRTTKNVYSLNTAKQVIMRRNLSCYRVCHCFLTPSFVLLGASAKSRCSGKLSHPSLLSRQVKTVIFIFKITITTKSPILDVSSISYYRVFHCFFTPSFVLLGASAKSRCLGKLSHPSLLSRQVKTVIFISKITTTTTKSPILSGSHPL